jgi:hypothetical protein
MPPGSGTIRCLTACSDLSFQIATLRSRHRQSNRIPLVRVMSGRIEDGTERVAEDVLIALVSPVTGAALDGAPDFVTGAALDGAPDVVTGAPLDGAPDVVTGAAIEGALVTWREGAELEFGDATGGDEGVLVHDFDPK